MALSREQILAKRPTFTESVPAPELGDNATLSVRRLKAGEFLALSEKAKANPATAYIYWIIATVIGDDGQPVFTDSDIPALIELDITLVERLSDAAQRINISKNVTGPNPPTPLAV